MCVFSGRSAIWGPWEIPCKEVEFQGIAAHIFENLRTFGCAVGMGGQQQENYTHPNEK